MQNLYWKIVRALGRGRITLINDDGVIQTAQVQLSEGELRDKTPRMAEYGLTSNPPAGSDAVLNFLGGDRNFGVIVATNHQQSRPTGLAEGEAMLYQQNGLKVYLSNGGLTIDAAGLPVVCNNATDFTVNCSGVFKVVAPGGVEFDTPLVKSTGDIQDNAGDQQRTMATMRSIYNSHDHEVSNVKAGSDSVISKTPMVTE